MLYKIPVLQMENGCYKSQVTISRSNNLTSKRTAECTQNYQGDLSLSPSGRRTWANAASSRRRSECNVANSTYVQV